MTFIFFSEFNEKYKLIKVHNYKPNKKTYNEIALFLDPGVREFLKEGVTEYSQIDRMHQLLEEGLPKNVFMSTDYPPEMNEDLAELHIEKTYLNNIKYKDDPQHICTPQFHTVNWDSFYEQFERVRHVWEQPSKIIGMGNICRLIVVGKHKPYMNKVLAYIVDNMKGKWIHVYGCPKWIIKKWKPILAYHNIKFSVDSTKWTRCNTKHMRNKYGGKYMCSGANRKEYYEDYINTL